MCVKVTRLCCDVSYKVMAPCLLPLTGRQRHACLPLYHTTAGAVAVPSPTQHCAIDDDGCCSATATTHPGRRTPAADTNERDHCTRHVRTYATQQLLQHPLAATRQRPTQNHTVRLRDHCTRHVCMSGTSAAVWRRMQVPTTMWLICLQSDMGQLCCSPPTCQLRQDCQSAHLAGEIRIH